MILYAPVTLLCVLSLVSGYMRGIAPRFCNGKVVSCRNFVPYRFVKGKPLFESESPVLGVRTTLPIASEDYLVPVEESNLKKPKSRTKKSVAPAPEADADLLESEAVEIPPIKTRKTRAKKSEPLILSEIENSPTELLSEEAVSTELLPPTPTKKKTTKKKVSAVTSVATEELTFTLSNSDCVDGLNCTEELPSECATTDSNIMASVIELLPPIETDPTPVPSPVPVIPVTVNITTILYPDGGTYTGEWVEGKRHGQGKYTSAVGHTIEGVFVHDRILSGTGTLVLPLGTLLQGTWVNGSLAGPGRSVTSVGAIYEGSFHQGKSHGYGVKTLPIGVVYQGQWVNGLLSGPGNQTVQDEFTFAGHWLEGTRHGQGRLSSVAGHVWEGLFNDGVPFTGQGELLLPDGGTIQGTWKDGKLEGFGKQVYANGAVYTGHYLRGKYHGYGEKVYQDNSSYCGQWSSNMRTGLGKYTDPQGNVWEGEFKHDLLMRGQGVIRLAVGNVLSGTWQGGQLHGNASHTFPNGASYQGEWVNGKKQGMGKTVNAIGDVAEGEFKEGKLYNGVRRTYSSLRPDFKK